MAQKREKKGQTAAGGRAGRNASSKRDRDSSSPVPSESQLRTIADTALDSMFLKDRQRRYTFVNRAMTELFGCKEADLLGKTPEEVFDAESARVVSEVDARCFAGEQVTEDRELQVGAETKWFQTIQVPVRDSAGNVAGVCGIVRDITDRVRGGAALAASEARYRHMVENISDVLYTIEVNGTVQYVSPSVKMVLGYAADEIVGTEYTTMVDPCDEERMRRDFAALLEGELLGPIEYRMVGRDGEARWIRTVSRPVIREGSVVSVEGVLSDITGLKEVEEALRQANERLKLQKEELQQKNVTLREIVAHIETEKMTIAKQVSANVDKVLMPALERLKKRMHPSLLDDLDRVEQAVADVTSKFGAKVTGSEVQMSRREIEVSNMIRSGMKSREISAALGISLRTVEVHRAKIRKKLGLLNESVNLAAYLQNLS